MYRNKLMRNLNKKIERYKNALPTSRSFAWRAQFAFTHHRRAIHLYQPLVIARIKASQPCIRLGGKKEFRPSESFCNSSHERRNTDISIASKIIFTKALLVKRKNFTCA